MTQPGLDLPEEQQRIADQLKISEAIGMAEAAANPMDEWTCRNGTKLKLRHAPQTLVADIVAKIERPRPPMVTDPDSGKTEPVPDHPDHIEALTQWAFDRSMAVFAGAIAYGVRITELGEGLHPVESDDWIDELEFVNEAVDDPDTVQIAREPRGKRFFHYMRYYILDDDVDFFAVSRLITVRTALTESEVMAMVANFRRLAIEYPDRIGAVTDWLDPDADTIAAVDTGDHLGV